jgi:hypothetical protein
MIDKENNIRIIDFEMSEVEGGIIEVFSIDSDVQMELIISIDSVAKDSPLY